MKITLLVVEDRGNILIDYCQWVLKQIVDNKVYQVMFWSKKKSPVWNIRKQMIEDALKTDCTHILFVDTDVIPPNGFIDKLVSYDADIVSGIYYDIDGKPIAYKDVKPYQGYGLEEVDVCCIGASLIKREVFEKIQYKEPWKVQDVDGDVRTCIEAKDNGFKIFVDYDLICEHFKLLSVPQYKLSN